MANLVSVIIFNAVTRYALPSNNYLLNLESLVPLKVWNFAEQKCPLKKKHFDSKNGIYLSYFESIFVQNGLPILIYSVWNCIVIILDVLLDLVSPVQSKKHKKTHGGVSILVRLQALACNFTKSNTPPWVCFTFFKLYKWYQITQRIIYT